MRCDLQKFKAAGILARGKAPEYARVMYQDVDDIDEIEEEAVSPNKVARLKMIALVLSVIVLLMLVMMFSSISKQRNPIEPDYASEQNEIYKTALSESDLPLRRARLIDFIKTYPNHNRIKEAQSAVNEINQADEKDWASVTEVFYDPVQSKPTKMAALELYEDLWGSELLGSRDEEIAALKVLIGELPPPALSIDESSETQDFTPPIDQFSDDVSGTIMAGGITVPKRTYIPPIQTPSTILPPSRRLNIVPPRIRKSKRARYPSRAQRRGVEAEVILALNIDDEGRVQMTELVSVRAPRYRKDFIKAAERAALQSKYYPQTVDGKPVPTSGLRKRYVFQMD